MHQPGARATNRLLAVSGVLMLAAWPACIGICLALLHVHRMTPIRGLVLLALPAPLIFGLLLVTLWRLADRRALQLVTIGLVDSLSVMLDDTRNYAAYIVDSDGTRSIYVDEIEAR